jgi:hypothetical protein
MKHIISASRRTDIPAFFTDWFIKRLDEGSVLVKNPYSGKVLEVSLRPGRVHSVVLWSKDFHPLLRRIEEVESRAPNLFFHFTITGVPKALEQHTPDVKDAVEDFIFISKRYSPAHIVWRFDPIVITDRLPFDFFEDSFARLAGLLKGRTTECYLSFMEPYKKVLRNFEKYTDHKLVELSIEEKQGYAKKLSAIAEKNKLKLFACCNEYLVNDNIGQARCIDGERLAKLFGDYELSAKPAPTREGCGCTRAIDIGAYDTCAHGCLYCYANSDKEKAKHFLKTFNPEQKGLGFDQK